MDKTKSLALCGVTLGSLRAAELLGGTGALGRPTCQVESGQVRSCHRNPRSSKRAAGLNLHCGRFSTM